VNRQKIAECIQDFAYKVPTNTGNGFYSHLNVVVASGLHLLRHHVTENDYMIKIQKEVFEHHVSQLRKYVRNTSELFWFGSSSCKICGRKVVTTKLISIKHPSIGNVKVCNYCKLSYKGRYV